MLFRSIDALDPDHPESDESLIEELGDLLYQIEFHATIAEQQGRFSMADVAQGIHDKLVRRHPHVFGDVSAEDTDELSALVAGKVHSRVPATLLIALGAFFPTISDSLNRAGSTELFAWGKFLGVVFLLLGFLVSSEVFREVRIPFTSIRLATRSRERAAGVDAVAESRGRTSG